MTWLRAVVAMVLVGAASQAGAARFGYCYVDFGGASDATRYVSSVVEVGTDPALMSPGGAFGQAFLDHVRSRYESGAASASCDAWETLNDARRAAFDSGIAGDVVRVRTNWAGGMREAGGSKVAKSAKTAKTASPVQSSKAAKAEIESASIKPPAPSGPPPKPKWEVEYEAKKAVYERELARQQAAVAEYEVAKAAHAKRQAEAAAHAAQERAEWERAVAACKAGDYSACAHPPRQ